MDEWKEAFKKTYLHFAGSNNKMDKYTVVDICEFMESVSPNKSDTFSWLEELPD